MTTQLRVLLSILVLLIIGCASVVFGRMWIDYVEGRDAAEAQESLAAFETPANWRTRACEWDRCFTTRDRPADVVAYLGDKLGEGGFDVSTHGSELISLSRMRFSRHPMTATFGRAELIVAVERGPYLGEEGSPSWTCDASTYPECIDDAPVLTEIRLSLTPH